MGYLKDTHASCEWTYTEFSEWVAAEYAALVGMVGSHATRMFNCRYRITSAGGNSRPLNSEMLGWHRRKAVTQYEDLRQSIADGVGGEVGQTLNLTSPEVKKYDRSGLKKLGGPCNSRGQMFSPNRDCGAHYLVSPEPTPAALNDQQAALLVVLDAVPDGDLVALQAVPTSPEYLAFSADDLAIAEWMHHVRCCLPDFQTVETVPIPL